MKTHNQERFFTAKIWIYITALMIISLTACTPSAQSIPETGNSASAAKTTPTTSGLTDSDLNQQSLIIRQTSANDNYQIEVIDLRSGEPVPGIQPVTLGIDVNYAYSPNRSSLAVTSKGAGCAGTCVKLFHLPDLQPVAVVDLPEVKGLNDWVHQLVFDAQSKRLALAYTEKGYGRLTMIDLAAPTPSVVKTIHFPISPSRMAFSGDGNHLMLVGHALLDDHANSPEISQTLQALLLDAQTLERIWVQELSSVKDGFFGSQDHTRPEENTVYQVGIAADATNQRMYIAHADAERLTTVDFLNRRTVTKDIREPQSTIERLVEFFLSIGVRPVQAKAANSYIRQALLSDDGRTLYVTGERTNLVKKSDNEWETVHTFYGLAAWSIEDGTRLLQVETESSEIRQGVAGYLILNGYNRQSSDYQPFSELFDPATGEITAHLDGIYAFPALRLDGSPVLVSVVSNDRGETRFDMLSAGSPSWTPVWTKTQQGGYGYWLEYR